MKSFKLKLQLWVPFLFSICLSAIVLEASYHAKSSNRFEAGFPAFFCFLPMVFFFVANSTNHQISVLEKRIEQLEERLGKIDKST